MKHLQALEKPELIAHYFFAFVFFTFVLQANAASQNELPPLTAIPAGAFISGSNVQEREYAYRLDGWPMLLQ